MPQESINIEGIHHPVYIFTKSHCRLNMEHVTEGDRGPVRKLKCVLEPDLSMSAFGSAEEGSGIKEGAKSAFRDVTEASEWCHLHQRESIAIAFGAGGSYQEFSFELVTLKLPLRSVECRSHPGSSSYKARL